MHTHMLIVWHSCYCNRTVSLRVCWNKPSVMLEPCFCSCLVSSYQSDRILIHLSFNIDSLWSLRIRKVPEMLSPVWPVTRKTTASLLDTKTAKSASGESHECSDPHTVYTWWSNWGFKLIDVFFFVLFVSQEKLQSEERVHIFHSTLAPWHR